MDTLLSWTSNQAVWLQVVIGLSMFFIGIPFALLLVYWVFRLLGGVLEAAELAFWPALLVFAACALLYLAWPVSKHVVTLVLGSSASSMGAVAQDLAALFLLAFVLSPTCYLTYRLASLLRSRNPAARRTNSDAL